MRVPRRTLIVFQSRLRRVVDGWVAAYLLRCQVEGMSAMRRGAGKAGAMSVQSTVRNGGAILHGAAVLYRFDPDVGT